MSQDIDLNAVVDDLSRRVTLLERQSEKKAPPPGFCHTSLQKGDLTQFFYILMEEGIFFFDRSNSKANRMKFQVFIEQHFTYLGGDGIQVPLKNISRHFSEAKGYTYREKHLDFIQRLISLLQERHNRLINK